MLLPLAALETIRPYGLSIGPSVSGLSDTRDGLNSSDRSDNLLLTSPAGLTCPASAARREPSAPRF